MLCIHVSLMLPHVYLICIHLGLLAIVWGGLLQG